MIASRHLAVVFLDEDLVRRVAVFLLVDLIRFDAMIHRPVVVSLDSDLVHRIAVFHLVDPGLLFSNEINSNNCNSEPIII